MSQYASAPPERAGWATAVSVGTFLPAFQAEGAAERRATVAALDAAGLDHLAVGDHVSFLGGLGFDGLVQAAHLLALSDRLPVHVGVYLLALRHPVLVARQLADLASLAPGRLVLGVGVGGEDRHEYRVCGVDPATRGRRTDESLALVRRLLSGDAVTSAGPCFPVEGARVLPATPDLPIVVGGRSEAALRRTAELGDGWLGIWVSPRRFAEATEHVAERAVAAGREGVDWRHGLQVWCGFGPTVEQATAPLARAMEAMYSTPFASFARYSPAGTAQDVAAFLQPYVDAGCHSFNLIPRADDDEHALAGVAEVARLLRG
jgi:alkanesulfonate monooxygenase SsuD/methylene tetrahydromethanopterin reductase-like flavin-dependent oxidoreductase (luciferase family)